MNKRVLVRTLVILGVVALIAGLAFARINASPQRDAGGSDNEASSAPRVTVEPVRATTLYDTLSLMGSVQAADEIIIQPEVSGRVIRLTMEDGQRVERGDVLLQLRDDALRAERQVAQRQAALLEDEKDRLQTALDQQAVSRQEYDLALGEWEIARAEISRLDAMIAERVVRAPFDGVIGLVEVSPGAIVTPDTHIATLRNLDELDVRFEVPERFASRIRLDQPLQLRAFDSQSLIDARITALESGLNTLNRTLPAQARLAPDASLRPGSLVQVRLILDERPGALTIPAAAITESLEGSSVWVLDGDTVRERAIEKGARTDAVVEVLKGLSEGERVVVTGRHSLEDGARVQVDDSEDAVDINDIAPESTTPGMRNQWFSEEELEATLEETR